MSNLFDLTGRTALITGAGRGIGREIARTLAAAGADIAIAELDPATAEDAATEIRGMGRQVYAVACNVRESASVNSAVASVLEHMGKIDILVNNAGIARWTKAEETSDTDWLGCNRHQPQWHVLGLPCGRTAYVGTRIGQYRQHCVDVRIDCQ